MLEEVQRDVVQLNRFYQSEGFLDASATLLGWTPSADFTCVNIRIRIDEGQPYYVRSIRLEGMTRYDPEKFRQLHGDQGRLPVQARGRDRPGPSAS